MKIKQALQMKLAVVLGSSALASSAFAQGTAFTYQGRLDHAGNPANGSYDLNFLLHDTASGGTPIGPVLSRPATALSNGLFTVTLDFGNQFPGANRWLEIAVRTNGGGAFSPLSPRQALTATPYAVQALNAANAATASSVAAASVTGTLPDARLSSNVALRAGGNTFAGNQTFSGQLLDLNNGSTLRARNSAGEYEDVLTPRFLNDATYLKYGSGGFEIRNHEGYMAVAMDTNRNVGIGHPYPQSKLHVNGVVTATGFSGPIDSASLTGTLPDAALPANVARRIGENTFYGDQIIGDGDLFVNNGRVGLGTTNPAYALQIGDNTIPGAEGMIRLASRSWTNDSNRIWDVGVPGRLADASGLGYSFIVDDIVSPGRELIIRWGTGNVGIGLDFPSEKLEVNGAVKAQTFKGTFVGHAAGLSNLVANQLTLGTLDDARLSGNVAMRVGGNRFSGNQVFSNGTVGIGIGLGVPARLLQVGDASLLGSEGMIRFASASSAGGASRRWDIGVPQTGNSSVGIGYSFVIDDIAIGGSGQPEFLIRWDTGNVGIGVTNPLSKLHVAGGALFAANVGIGTTSPAAPLSFSNALGDKLSFWDNGSSRYGMGVQGNLLQVYADASASDIGFGYGSSANFTERMRIKGDGNVGIGTTDPGLNRLQINPRFMAADGYGLVVSRADYGADVQINRPAGTGGIGLLVDNFADGDSSTSLLLVRNNNATEIAMNVRADGRTQVKELEITGGADLSEPFNITDNGAKPGMVMAIDPDKPGELRIATAAYDRTVAGIISGAGGVKPGLTLRQHETAADGSHPVALSGRVYCWVDADANGSVRPGDLLTTSDTPGHAMRATDHARANGALIGKAMTRLETGRGLVLVLVSLQ